MTFDDVKDQIKTQALQLFDRIQETPTYLSLKDRYDTLSPSRQKAVIGGAVALILLIVFSIPLSTYWTSVDNISQYESKKDLIRDLLRAHKEAEENSLTVNPPPIDQVRAQAEQTVQMLSLLPEQNHGVNIQAFNSPLIKGSIVEGVVEVSTAELNLRQIMNIATGLAKIPGTKLKDLIMNANARDPRYFDTVFRVVVFKGAPQVESAPEPVIRGNHSGSGNGSIPPPPPPKKKGK